MSSRPEGMSAHQDMVEHRMNLMGRTKVAIGVIGNDGQLGIVRRQAVEWASWKRSHTSGSPLAVGLVPALDWSAIIQSHHRHRRRRRTLLNHRFRHCCTLTLVRAVC